MNKQARTEQAQAIESLRELLRPGDTVYTILRSVSRSGMTRHISTVIPSTDGLHDITYLVGRALDHRMDRNDGGLVVSGCGMDMGFSVVYDIGRVVWPEGFDCIGQDCRCPSNDHSNGDRNYSPDHLHESGGYALRHRWL